ncbi:MAG: phage major capsid protein [Beijerinckiaceae bacterium]|jgi:HK97 family phage major capsid protein|nr:phage major capsid protein [Beijerinckiaceae bacterium]
MTHLRHPEAGAPETKALSQAEEFDNLNRLVAEYRSENDDRRAAADPLQAEKFSRMDRAIDQCMDRIRTLETKGRRPALGFGEEGVSLAALEHKGAFESYLRSGETQALQRLEIKSTTSMTAPDGGYLLPMLTEESVLARIAGLSPIRSIASVQAVSGSGLRKAVTPTGAQSGWTGDAAPGNAVQASAFVALDFPTGELFTQPAATQAMLDDVAVDIEGWISSEIVRAFAAAETTAFVNGNGTNKPKGFLTYPTLAQASWSWNNLGFVTTGAAGAFAASNPSDSLVDLAHALKAVYRQNGTFVMNRKTQGAIRKLKDTTGNFIWQPPSMAGARSTLLNFPVVEAEDMPDIAANSLSVAFGDFQRGYVVVDRIGIRTMRDPFSTKPFVIFYTTKRVGGGVQDFDAIKLLRFSV